MSHAPLECQISSALVEEAWAGCRAREPSVRLSSVCLLRVRDEGVAFSRPGVVGGAANQTVPLVLMISQLGFVLEFHRTPRAHHNARRAKPFAFRNTGHGRIATRSVTCVVAPTSVAQQQRRFVSFHIAFCANHVVQTVHSSLCRHLSATAEEKKSMCQDSPCSRHARCGGNQG